MARAAVTACFVVAIAAIAAADRVVLVDGRSFSGTVVSDAETVSVVTTLGSVRFPRSEVRAIIKDIVEEEYAHRLEALPQDDAVASLQLAQWASQNNLTRQAEELYGRVVKLDPDNALARKALGSIKFDGEWRSFDQCMELARTKLDAGQAKGVLDLLDRLQEQAAGKDRQLAVRELQASALLRVGRFAESQKLFADVAEKSAGLAAVRLGTIAEILKDNSDGMYVLGESYPPSSDLLEEPAGAIKPGPASLTDPLVLQAALRDRAKKEIEAARKYMDESQKVEASDADAAKAKNALAIKSLDRAEALVPNIGRSYRVEIIRRRISSLRKDCDAEAGEFDKELTTLGTKGLTSPAYRSKVLRLIYLLDNVRQDLKEILAVAKPYAKDLVLEMKWAELDLKKIEDMRQVLTGELDGKK